MPPSHAAGHAVVLFAHGSRDPRWSEPIEAVARTMRELAPDVPVACAYLELTAPDLPTCVQALASQGARAITVWPMFLGAGRHAREDLPRIAEQLRTSHPGIVIDVRTAIGEHPNVLACMARTALDGITEVDAPIDRTKDA